MSDHNPAISIIMATYNRSNILPYSISSVLHSTFSDWELIIVGDACTDDTPEVVAAFEDPRIRFINLEKNFGDQSGPNNVGFEMARGRYIAYLNHDDLYFPDHLQSSLEMIEKTGADLVFSGVASAERVSSEAMQRGEWRFLLKCISPTGKYEPFVVPYASSWFLRRELIEEIGPWRSALACYWAPSQDFLFRAWKAGKDLRSIPRVTVLAVVSGFRLNVYLNREQEENAFYRTQMAEDPGFREKVLNHIAVDHACRSMEGYFSFNIQAFTDKILRILFYKPLLWFGVHPQELRHRVKNLRRGKFIQDLRRKRGLKEIQSDP